MGISSELQFEQSPPFCWKSPLRPPHHRCLSRWREQMVPPKFSGPALAWPSLGEIGILGYRRTPRIRHRISRPRQDEGQSTHRCGSDARVGRVPFGIKEGSPGRINGVDGIQHEVCANGSSSVSTMSILTLSSRREAPQLDWSKDQGTTWEQRRELSIWADDKKI